jgi:hypothetical protein
MVRNEFTFWSLSGGGERSKGKPTFGERTVHRGVLERFAFVLVAVAARVTHAVD